MRNMIGQWKQNTNRYNITNLTTFKYNANIILMGGCVVLCSVNTAY